MDCVQKLKKNNNKYLIENFFFRKLKNKRTVAAVSPEDKMAALAAMEELRSRGTFIFVASIFFVSKFCSFFLYVLKISVYNTLKF